MGRTPIIQFYFWGPANLQVGAYVTIAKSELTSIITGVAQGLCIWTIPRVLEMRQLRP